MKLLKEIKGVFKSPKKRYYLGKIHYGTPYFSPINFCSSIIKIRRLVLRNEEEFLKLSKSCPWNKESNKFINLPMVRRTKNWIIKIFNNYYYIEVGYPIIMKVIELGWKWKYDSVRFEWVPSFQIYFFKWQFCIFWGSPDGDDDKYYEQILWWKYGAGKDLTKAKETWGWINYDTKQSTWDNNYLL